MEIRTRFSGQVVLLSFGDNKIKMARKIYCPSCAVVVRLGKFSFQVLLFDDNKIKMARKPGKM